MSISRIAFAISVIAGSALAAPASSSTSVVPAWSTDAPAPTVPNSQAPTASPQPITGNLGAPILGPQNVEMEVQNIDEFAPPSTDHGTTGYLKWPFSLSHNRLQSGGWARQQNLQNLPIATAMAGVNMRLEEGAYRELHWHTVAEWSIVLAGCTMVTGIDTKGRTFSDTVCEGDLWYFPPGLPHSLQGVGENGTEFLLVFDNGDFSEDSTFQLTDWLAHVPKEVLAKNFHTSIATFNRIPSQELYIFPGEALPDGTKSPSPNGEVLEAFTLHWSNISETPCEGGSVKIADTGIFPVSQTISVQKVTVNPGAMRELHWHPTAAEWTFYLQGNARMTAFASAAVANTFTYQAGDIGYVPPSYGHYVENTGEEDLVFLEIFNSPIVEDISLAQWLRLTPWQIVQAHLGLSQSAIESISTDKLEVV